MVLKEELLRTNFSRAFPMGQLIGTQLIGGQ